MMSAIGLLVTSLLATILPTSLARADNGLLPNAIVINGRGYGHGRGMSQYGAYGWATNGSTWEEILNFYYGGVTGNTIGSLADPAQITFCYRAQAIRGRPLPRATLKLLRDSETF